MLARTHITTALLLGLIFLPPPLTPLFAFEYILLLIFTTLLADLDHPQSTAGKEFPITSFTLHRLLGHRGLLHSPLIPLAGWIASNVAGQQSIGTPIIIGLTSHLLCDALTKTGINLLSPIATLRIRGCITTGGRMENIFFWIITGLLLAVLSVRLAY